MGIKLKLNEDGQKLVVTEVLEDHNHIVDKVLVLFQKLYMYKLHVYI